MKQDRSEPEEMSDVTELSNPSPVFCPLLSFSARPVPAISLKTPDLSGVQLAVVQLKDLQGSLEVGLWLQQFQLDWSQAVNTGG